MTLANNVCAALHVHWLPFFAYAVLLFLQVNVE